MILGWDPVQVIAWSDIQFLGPLGGSSGGCSTVWLGEWKGEKVVLKFAVKPADVVCLLAEIELAGHLKEVVGLGVFLGITVDRTKQEGDLGYVGLVLAWRGDHLFRHVNSISAEQRPLFMFRVSKEQVRQLKRAAESGLVHSDIKMTNVTVDTVKDDGAGGKKPGVVTVIDWGMGKVIDVFSGEVKGGNSMGGGTLKYMPDEVLGMRALLQSTSSSPPARRPVSILKAYQDSHGGRRKISGFGAGTFGGKKTTGVCRLDPATVALLVRGAQPSPGLNMLRRNAFVEALVTQGLNGVIPQQQQQQQPQQQAAPALPAAGAAALPAPGLVAHPVVLPRPVVQQQEQQQQAAPALPAAGAAALPAPGLVAHPVVLPRPVVQQQQHGQQKQRGAGNRKATAKRQPQRAGKAAARRTAGRQ
uniref:Protein kinase domain-containing protein n=1 Tax=Chromera velia CCMP2878 TaxID=1169474 RepID=A0A0G4F3E9_9ALVE|eukprot:Cvel_14775.t1-p1 / transcript=Cvel_14775.t1 / gene=Cvel_14775 / organism=Chromera_velia_CCMP2878 / gene_product=hypothetical protein / transcript_product=hypothetical protein / location=Cvel_scaffold1064:14713-16704(-) / protein_length=415 / sequence_SO=supercontig / SO=protein_coding / is_pseudo=false